MKLSLLIVLFATSFSSFASLCLKTEDVIFSCPTKNGKFISVCLGSGIPVQYLFGVIDKIELTLPKSKDDKVSYNSIMYSGGGGGYVRFKAGVMEYIVHSTMGKGFDRAGVIVQKGGKKIAEVICKTSTDVNLSMLEKLKIEKEEFGIDPTI